MSHKKGFIGILILIIAALALLKYFFAFDVLDKTPGSKSGETVSYVRSVIDTVWGYISGPAHFIWDRIVWPVLSLAWSNLQQLQHTGTIPGQPNLPNAP